MRRLAAELVVGGPEFRPFPVAVPRSRSLWRVLRREGENLAPVRHENIARGRDACAFPRASTTRFLPPLYAVDLAKAPVYRSWLNIRCPRVFCAPRLRYTRHSSPFNLTFLRCRLSRHLARLTRYPPRRPGDAAVEFIDEVIRLLTGEAGVFSSKSAYIKQTKAGKALSCFRYRGRLRAPPDGPFSRQCPA